MFDFYKSFEANTKLAREVTAQVGSATMEFTKAVTEVNTRLAETFKTQAVEAYKGLESFKFPGLDAVTKTSKKSAE
ncbi:hypothetical protein UFOVP71_298 [uncultured Caudovirales phage]|uniref:Phasin family protein n=1 Tax=uncultured Caudovirales phage TaxID=2100421 RepID=A0A6J5TDN9_9CAUD|nr:hypothetical protein UFOVP71_298 [uncultured Caudovirales phage]